MLVKIGVNRFGRNDHLVTRVASSLGKWILLSSMTPSLTVTTWSTSSTMTQSMACSMAGPKLRMRSYLRNDGKPSTGRPSPSSRSKISPTSNGVILVLSILWSLLESSQTWRRQGTTWGWAQRVIISAPSADSPVLVMDVKHKKYDSYSFKTVRNASYITYCLAPRPRSSMIIWHCRRIHDHSPYHIATQTINRPYGKLWYEGHGAAQNIIFHPLVLPRLLARSPQSWMGSSLVWYSMYLPPMFLS